MVAVRYAMELERVRTLLSKHRIDRVFHTLILRVRTEVQEQDLLLLII